MNRLPVRSQGEVPKYQRVKRSLLERIARRQYTESAPVPSEQALAKELKVAPMTVWRAMKELVDEGVLVRYVGRGTFVRRMPAGMPSGREAGSVALRRLGVLHASDWQEMQANPVHYLTFLEIQAECARRGVGLEFLPFRADCDAATAVRLVADHGCQAVTVLSWARYEIPLALRDAGIPIVIAGHSGEADPVSFVSPNNFQGSRLITRHLLALGHRHIGLVNSGLSNSVSAEREAGWRTAVNEASADDTLVYRIDARHASLDQLRGQLVDQFVRRRPPSALFARDGLAAYAAILALGELGLECPRDVSIACIGSYYERAIHMPHVTAAVLPDGALARGVLRLVEDLVAGRQDSPAGLLLPMHVVEGTTTFRVQ